MDTVSRAPRKKRGTSGAKAGTFNPRLPTDTQEVMRVFAIAARVVCDVPANLGAVTNRLTALSSRLVPPESEAAKECQRLWQLFARVAHLPKEALREEAGKAFCRDLDALGQHLDLPPSDDWDELPRVLDDPAAFQMDAETPAAVAVSLASMRDDARAHHALRGTDRVATANQTLRLLSSLNNADLHTLFAQLIGQGVAGRSDINLLIRWLVKGESASAADVVLIDIAERLGRWLAQ